MKKLITLIASIVLFLSLNVSGQLTDRFTSKKFVEEIIRSQWVNPLIEERGRLNNYWKYKEGSLHDLYISPGSRMIIEAKYTSYNSWGPEVDNNNFIRILYDGELPYAFTTNQGFILAIPSGRLTWIDNLLTDEEKKRIEQLNKDIVIKTRLEEPSYQAILANWRKYPASYNSKGKLVQNEQVDVTTTYETKSVQIDAHRDMDIEVPRSREDRYCIIKNISDQPILIKGIAREMAKPDSDHYIYIDMSEVLKPGEEMKRKRTLTFVREFDDEGRSVQYIEEEELVNSGKSGNAVASVKEKLNATAGGRFSFDDLGQMAIRFTRLDEIKHFKVVLEEKGYKDNSSKFPNSFISGPYFIQFKVDEYMSMIEYSTAPLPENEEMNLLKSFNSLYILQKDAKGVPYYASRDGELFSKYRKNANKSYTFVIGKIPK